MRSLKEKITALALQRAVAPNVEVLNKIRDLELDWAWLLPRSLLRDTRNWNVESNWLWMRNLMKF